MVLAASVIPVAPVVIFMACGVLIAMFGHASKSRGTVLAGLMILFIATGAMFIGAYIAFQGDERDPRPECGKTCPKEGEPGYKPPD
jgi:hypothetical protein